MRLTFLLCLIGLASLTALTGCKDGLVEPDRFGSIDGRVVDFETGNPVSGAGITTSPATDATVTAEDGGFAVADALVGSYTITANRNGYTPNTATVSVREGRTTQATVFLRTAPAVVPDTSVSDLTAEVTGFFNRRLTATNNQNDSTVVVVDYRVRNTGSTLVSNYEIYFRIATPNGDFFEEVRRTALAAGQTDIGRFQKDLGGAVATEVRVDGFFLGGQRSAPRPTGRATRG